MQSSSSFWSLNCSICIDRVWLEGLEFAGLTTMLFSSRSTDTRSPLDKLNFSIEPFGIVRMKVPAEVLCSFRICMRTLSVMHNIYLLQFTYSMYFLNEHRIFKNRYVCSIELIFRPQNNLTHDFLQRDLRPRKRMPILRARF